MARKDLVRTTASIDGTPIPGEFRSFSGGELTSADIKSTRGAGGPQVARGGRQTVGNVTIGREDDGTFDVKAASSKRGKGRMVVTRTPLDNDNNPLNARAITYTGILLAVRPGDGDNESDTDLDEFELEMSCDSVVS
jgi:hypothetical protein